MTSLLLDPKKESTESSGDVVSDVASFLSKISDDNPTQSQTSPDKELVKGIQSLNINTGKKVCTNKSIIPFPFNFSYTISYCMRCWSIYWSKLHKIY